MPIVGPETYVEVLEGLLERRRLAVAHCRGKDTESGGPKGNKYVCIYIYIKYIYIYIYILVLLFYISL